MFTFSFAPPTTPASAPSPSPSPSCDSRQHGAASAAAVSGAHDVGIVSPAHLYDDPESDSVQPCHRFTPPIPAGAGADDDDNQQKKQKQKQQNHHCLHIFDDIDTDIDDSNKPQDTMEHSASSSVAVYTSGATVPAHLVGGGGAAAVDVVAGVYEGGYKLWEGSVDLARYLFQHPQRMLMFRGRSVVELGAGHGLPSIVAAWSGATLLALHDLNDDVLRDVTAVNMRLNGITGDDSCCSTTTKKSEFECMCKCEYYAGGWGQSVIDAAGGGRFDYVLTAETMYQASNVPALVHAVAGLLKDPCGEDEEGGTAFVAGKQYYFGVGGGMTLFEEAARRYDCGQAGVELSVQRVDEVRDGVSNVRQVVKVVKHRRRRR